MSSDIISRLREDCFTGQIPQHKVETVLEAADEIEELRLKITKLQQSLLRIINETY